MRVPAPLGAGSHFPPAATEVELFTTCTVLYDLVDRILIDLVLVEGTGTLARGLAAVFRRAQSGRVPAYAAWFMAGTVAVLAALTVLGGK